MALCVALCIQKAESGLGRSCRHNRLWWLPAYLEWGSSFGACDQVNKYYRLPPPERRNKNHLTTAVSLNWSPSVEEISASASSPWGTWGSSFPASGCQLGGHSSPPLGARSSCLRAPPAALQDRGSESHPQACRGVVYFYSKPKFISATWNHRFESWHLRRWLAWGLCGGTFAASTALLW